MPQTRRSTCCLISWLIYIKQWLLPGLKHQVTEQFFTHDCVFVCRHIVCSDFSIFPHFFSVLFLVFSRFHFPYPFTCLSFFILYNCPSPSAFSYVAARSRRGRGSEMSRPLSNAAYFKSFFFIVCIVLYTHTCQCREHYLSGCSICD